MATKASNIRRILLSSVFFVAMASIAMGSDEPKPGSSASTFSPASNTSSSAGSNCGAARSCMGGCGDLGAILLRSDSADALTAAAMLRIAEGCVEDGDVVRCKSGEPVRGKLDGKCIIGCLEKSGFNGNLPTFYDRCK